MERKYKLEEARKHGWNPSPKDAEAFAKRLMLLGWSTQEAKERAEQVYKVKLS